MRKIISFFGVALLAVNVVWGQDLYVRFNKVPAESGIKTGILLTPVSFAELSGEPTDAYKMEAPAEGSDIYTLTLNLPAGDYEYQVTFKDTVIYESTHNMAKAGRPFSVKEQKDIVFRAKVHTVNAGKETEYKCIKFLCDAQTLHYSNTTTFISGQMFPEPDEQGNTSIVFTHTNYKGAIEMAICPPTTTIYSSDVLPFGGSKYRLSVANGKVRWKLTYNRHTLTLEEPVQKLVTLLDGDTIIIDAEKVPAAELPANIGAFSVENPLLLAGGTTSVSARIDPTGEAGAAAEKPNDLLKLAPETIEAKMYYNVFNADSTEMIVENNALLVTTADATVPEYETVWTMGAPLNVTGGLSAGDYTLNVWYETVCYGDTIQSAIYSTDFSVSGNPTTGFEQPTLQANVFTAGQAIQAIFDGTATVKLYAVSGQLLDEQTVSGNYNKMVHPGLYILQVADKSYRLAVK